MLLNSPLLFLRTGIVSCWKWKTKVTGSIRAQLQNREHLALNPGGAPS